MISIHEAGPQADFPAHRPSGRGIAPMYQRDARRIEKLRGPIRRNLASGIESPQMGHMTVAIFGIVPILHPLLQLSPALPASARAESGPSGARRPEPHPVQGSGPLRSYWKTSRKPSGYPSSRRLRRHDGFAAFAGVFSGEIEGTQISQPCRGSSVRKSRKNSQASFSHRIDLRQIGRIAAEKVTVPQMLAEPSVRRGPHAR